MINPLRKGILYFLMAAVTTAALITIRPATKALPPTKASVASPLSGAAVLPSDNQNQTFELKLLEGILYFASYTENGEIVQRETIDYIDLYSLYPEQLLTLQKGITFSNKESAAEFIQDLGS